MYSMYKTYSKKHQITSYLSSMVKTQFKLNWSSSVSLKKLYWMNLSKKKPQKLLNNNNSNSSEYVNNGRVTKIRLIIRLFKRSLYNDTFVELFFCKSSETVLVRHPNTFLLCEVYKWSTRRVVIMTGLFS